MPITKDNVTDSLRYVIDPNLGKDLVSLNRIRDIQIEGRNISFTVYLGSPERSMKDEIKQACINTVKHLVDKNAVVTPKITSETVQNQPEYWGDQNPLPDVKNIIAVASGKGGVGKSTISVNLALSLVKTGAKVGLMDTDIYGPSIPTMFDLHERPAVNRNQKIVPLEKYGVRLLSMGFLVEPDQAVVWRAPMVSSAVKQFLSDTEWGKLDYLILDLPPGTGDVQLTVVQSVPLSGAIIVSTPQNVALDDARKGVAMFRKVNVPILGIVENMAYFTPPDRPDRNYYIFGKNGAKNLAKKMNVSFLGEIPIEQKLRESGDTGKPVLEEDTPTPSSLAFIELGKRVAQKMALHNASTESTVKR